MKEITRVFPRSNFFMLLATLLKAYHYWENSLGFARKNGNSAFQKGALILAKQNGCAALILLENLHKDPDFMNELSTFCEVHEVGIDPKKVISDILAERHIMEHLECN